MLLHIEAARLSTLPLQLFVIHIIVSLYNRIYYLRVIKVLLINNVYLSHHA